MQNRGGARKGFSTTLNFYLLGSICPLQEKEPILVGSTVSGETGMGEF